MLYCWWYSRRNEAIVWYSFDACKSTYLQTVVKLSRPSQTGPLSSYRSEPVDIGKDRLIKGTQNRGPPSRDRATNEGVRFFGLRIWRGWKKKFPTTKKQKSNTKMRRRRHRRQKWNKKETERPLLSLLYWHFIKITMREAQLVKYDPPGGTWAGPSAVHLLIRY